MAGHLNFAQRLSWIKPSATLAISEKAAALRAQGLNIVNFGIGEPDFQTPAHISLAAKSAIDQGATKYTAVRGINPLLDAIAADSERRRKTKATRQEIVVTVGAKQSLFNLAMALYEAGDEVIIPSPYWVSYPEQVSLFGATPKIAVTQERNAFKLTPEELTASISDKTKAIILCTPSNPTGSAYSRNELRALADVMAKHNFWIIVDEIYGELAYAGELPSLLEVAPELKDRIIIVDGVSKTYAMTGWRIGWIIAPAKVASAVDMMQGQATSNAAAVSQHAALAALTSSREDFEKMRGVFKARRDLMCGRLNIIPGFQCLIPDGAFYAFPSVRGFFGKVTSAGKTLENDLDVTEFLLSEAHIAVVPGSAFGAEGYVRFSYATSETLINQGLDQVESAIKTLR